MPIVPKIEKITRDAAISYFLLMFGYKLFSLYFPLFLVAKGFSLPQVGYVYLLIYLPIAVFSPLVGFLNHKANPAVLTVAGILGYAIYSLGMIFVQNQTLFYLLQIFLGLSAALFYASSKTILVNADLENPDRAFAWYYSAATYTQAVAPAVGALAIWKFGFTGVFALSVILYLMNAVFSFGRLNGHIKNASSEIAGFKPASAPNYRKVFGLLKEKSAAFLILASFAVLVLGGFYHAFFVLFLKQNLAWSQNEILLFNSLLSLAFLFFSIAVIKFVEKSESEKNILQGGFVVGIFSILFGLLAPALNFLSVFAVRIFDSAANLVTESGRSGLLARKLKNYPSEAGAIDTIFSPLGTALGALIGGVLISYMSYSAIFIAGGIFVAALAILINFSKIKAR